MFEQPIPTLRRDGDAIIILDQTVLPFHTQTLALRTLSAAAHAIRSMQVRGAPLIGATAAHGVALALVQDGAGDQSLTHALQVLGATRPTAVNLHWALARMARVLHPLTPAARVHAAWAEAEAIRADDAASCDAIGRHGLALIAAIAARQPAEPGALQLLTFAKAYAGLSDAEFKAVDAVIRASTLEKFGPVRSLKPALVFELAFEGINRSPRHKSGVALRFPRMLRIRHDKPLWQADSLGQLQALVNAQGV